MLKNKRLLALLVILICILLYIPTNKLISGGITTNTLIDQYIPLLPIFIIPYVLAWPFWGLSLAIFGKFLDDKRFHQMFISFAIAGVLSAIIYVVFPTYVIRPAVVGSDVFSNMIKILYSNDSPYNALPSGHTFYTFLCMFYYLKFLKNRYLKILIVIFAALVVASTVFTKQHYLLDIVAGSLFALFAYYISRWLASRIFK